MLRNHIPVYTIKFSPSIDNDIFGKNLPENQMFDTINFENISQVYEEITIIHNIATPVFPINIQFV